MSNECVREVTSETQTESLRFEIAPLTVSRTAVSTCPAPRIDRSSRRQASKTKFYSTASYRAQRGNPILTPDSSR